MGSALSSVVFQPPPPSYKVDRRRHYLKVANTQQGTELVAAYINPGQDFTILFSHGNAEDIGHDCAYFEQRLCPKLQVSAVVYDYTGYGCSSAVPPTQESVYSDIAAMYNHMTEELGIPPSRIIVYGRSLGTAATVDLAASLSRQGLPPMGGIVLQSPMLSIYRIALNLRYTLPGDWCTSVDKVRHIQSPTLIVHGVFDGVVPFWHSQEMVKHLREAKVTVGGLWLHAAHNDIEALCYAELTASLGVFLDVIHRANLRHDTEFQRIPDNAATTPTSDETHSLVGHERLREPEKDRRVSASRVCVSLDG